MGLYEREYYQDSSDFQPVRPWNGRSMISILIIINVAVFLGNFIFGSVTENPVNEHLWLHPSDLSNPARWYRLLGNGFAHSKDITHILFNMLGLYLMGQVVELKYGRGEFLRFYLITIILCSLGWALKHRLFGATDIDNRVLLGASGGVTAVTMLFVFNFPNMTLHAFGVVPIKSWVFGIFVVVMNLFGTAKYQVGQAEQVAYDVHLIGAGFAAIYFYAGLNFGAIGTVWGKLAGMMKSKPKLKIHEPESAVADSVKEEADRILEKLHREGQDSLTAQERKTLVDYSFAMRKQRRNERLERS
ncbi:MAG: rhomboid family intramembrane serine protease [Pirellulales bacterium]